MLRTQQLLMPAVLLGCLTVIFLTNLVFQPEKVNAATLSDQTSNTGLVAELLASVDFETTTEVPTQAAPQTNQKPAGKSQPKKKSSSQSNNSNYASNISTQPGSSSNCSIPVSYPMEVRQWCSLIDNYSQAQNLDPDLIAAVILEESGGDAQAYSSNGAVGLMQIMPRDGLAAGFSCGSSPCFSSRPSMNELYDPEFNISYGARLLGSLNGKYGNVRDALLAYGPSNVGYYYADIVLDIYARYK